MSGSERRRDPRVALPTSIQYRLLDVPNDLWRGAVATNISAGGLRVRIAQALKPSARVELEIPLPDRQEPHHFLAEVMWAKGLPRGGNEYGLAFIEVTPERQFQIDQIVHFLIRRRVPRWPV